MVDPQNDAGTGTGSGLFPSLQRRRRSSRSPFVALGVLLLLALVAGAGWFWLRGGEEDPAPPTTPVQEAMEPELPPVLGPDDSDVELPDRDASDAFIRELAERLSSHPRFAAWLVTEDLLHRFVVAVVNLSGGGSPAEPLDFMAPEEAFSVAQPEPEQMVVDPEGYRRYDTVTEVFASLDPEGTAELYNLLEPLIQETYDELGLPDREFHDLLAEAIRNLLAVEVPTTPPALVPGEEGVVYEFRDPELEGRSEAAKHLFRMGPENAVRLQGTLRELAGPLGVPLP